MFGRTYAYEVSFIVRFTFDGVDGRIVSLSTIVSLIKHAFSQLDWVCNNDADFYTLLGAPYSMQTLNSKCSSAPSKLTSIAKQVSKYLLPQHHLNMILSEIDDHIIWTFREANQCDHEASLKVYITRQKMSNSEAKAKLNSVVQSMLKHVSICVNSIGASISVTQIEK